MADLLAARKALRDRVPRQAHARWKRAAHRIDPIQILRVSDEGRLPELVPIRYGRMLQSAVRLLSRLDGGDGRRSGCDAHYRHQGPALRRLPSGEFRRFATPERNIIFDINDFDETLPGPWEWGVKRLVASFMLAARSNGLTDAQGRDAAAVVARSYRKSLREFVDMHPLAVWYSRVTANDFIMAAPKRNRAAVQKRVERALARAEAKSDVEYPRLANMVGGHIGIHDAPPLIFHPQGTNTPEFRKLLDRVFADYRQTLPDDRLILLDQYRVVDAAIKVVGVGSIGRRCWIALLMCATNDPLFLQFKEAAASVLEPYAGNSAYTHHGQRVVIGQRLIQPTSDLFLGWITAKTPMGHRHFYVRQLRDSQIRPQVETFDAEFLSIYAKACGRVLAHAHAKTGDQCTISGYLGTSDQFDEAMADFAVAYAD